LRLCRNLLQTAQVEAFSATGVDAHFPVERLSRLFDEPVQPLRESLVVTGLQEGATSLKHPERVSSTPSALAQEVYVALTGDIEGVPPRATVELLSVGERRSAHRTARHGTTSG
jgi:hypothetical protein